MLGTRTKNSGRGVLEFLVYLDIPYGPPELCQDQLKPRVCKVHNHLSNTFAYIA